MSESRIPILHVIPSLAGGAGRGAIELLRRLLQDRRFQTRLCVLGANSQEIKLTEDDPVEFLNAPVHQRQRLIPRLFRLRQMIASWKPQLIHSHLWPAATTVSIVAPRSIPHLIHIRDTPAWFQSDRWGPTLRRMLCRRLFACPHVSLVAVSNVAADYAATELRLNPERIQTVVNGVELDRFLQLSEVSSDRPSDRFVIASVGRLISDKGFDQVLHAVQQLSTPRDQVQLRIAGTGSAEGKLRELATSLGIAAQVEFAGQVTDMPSFLQSSHLFVHSSVSEGMSRSIIEAMAAARAVVATAHAGVQDLVIPNETGVVVPAGSPAVLAQAIDQLLFDRPRLADMGRAGRARARSHFSAERVAQEIGEIYMKTLYR